MPVARTIDGSTPRHPRLDALRARVYGVPLRMAVSKPFVRNRPVYFCSYPKTGRTWLRFLLSDYMARVFELDTDVDLSNMFEVLPNLSMHRRRGIRAFAYRDDLRVPLVLATHAPFDAALFARRTDIVLLLRGVHDVIVSSYFHSTRQRRESERFRGSLCDFIDDPYKGVARFARYYNDWAVQVGRAPSLIATYERLHSDQEAALLALLEFLRLPLDNDALTAAREAAAFDAMKSLERREGVDGRRHDPSDPEAMRVRKGRVGGYTEYLDGRDIERISQLCHRTMSAQALDLFERNGLRI